jgi:hypothetical protein
MSNTDELFNEDDDDLIALCVDCGTTQNEERALKDPFLLQGDKGLCGMCGGPVLVVSAKNRDQILARRERGEVF